MRRDLQDTMEEKGCLGKTENTMKTSEKHSFKIVKEENTYCQQLQIIHVTFIYTTVKQLPIYSIVI